jgi:TonB-dependent starch-binding outer membrane protein SusC
MQLTSIIYLNNHQILIMQMKKSMQKQFGYLLVTIALTVAFSMFSVMAMAQTTVSGKITDSKDGTPVVGVTVAVKGAKGNAQTGADGTYSIKVPAGATTLVFTSVGFAKQELPVAASVNVSFVATNQQLNEVVVVGYGTVKKKDLTGSLTTISSKDFQKGAIATPEQLILGKVAGVSIVSNGGAPGAGSTIRIRGGASLSGSNDPLIIIDGVQLSGGGIAGSANPLSLINPNDIETFNVLKDAAAVSIYGSRASNGVIIITTKKGKSGKAKINFSTQISIATLPKKIDVLSADEFKAFVNANGTATQKALIGTANTDWQKEVFQTAIARDNNLSISGSTKGKIKMPYRIAAGYFNQDGILRTGNLQRLTAGININPRFFNDHLKLTKVQLVVLLLLILHNL